MPASLQAKKSQIIPSKSEHSVSGKPKNPETNLRYGKMPTFSNQKLWSRGILILGLLIYLWYSQKNGNNVLAKTNQFISIRGQTVQCDSLFLKEIKKFPGCVPKRCGRYVSDSLVTPQEAEVLLQLGKDGIGLGGSRGGASILDLHSGALSYGDKFINVYTLDQSKNLIKESSLNVYNTVKNKIKDAIAENFGIDVNSIYLTHPTFFSKLTDLEPVSIHDEYWHIHVDKETYQSFHFTSLLYLTDFSTDFNGGRFVFVDSKSKPSQNSTVEPRKGRVLMFTSGAENPHFVERVTDGVRYAITVSFTCDSTKAIEDPHS